VKKYLSQRLLKAWRLKGLSECNSTMEGFAVFIMLLHAFSELGGSPFGEDALWISHDTRLAGSAA